MTSLLDLFLAGSTDRDFPPLLIGDDELAAFRARVGRELLHSIHEAGLDERVLFVIDRLHRETPGLQFRPIDGASRKKIRRQLSDAAKVFTKAAKALEDLLLIELPYDPSEWLTNLHARRPLLGNEIDDMQHEYRVPALEEASAHLQSLKTIAATFSKEELSGMSPEIATAWKRVGTMNETEYYPHFVNECAMAARAFWLNPFQVSDRLFATFRGKRIGSEAVIRALFEELRYLAAQADTAAKRVTALGSPTGKGRKHSTTERSFRAMFSEYAQRITGRPRDDIGAQLFSLTIRSVAEEDYARQRRSSRSAGRRKST